MPPWASSAPLLRHYGCNGIFTGCVSGCFCDGDELNIHSADAFAAGHMSRVRGEGCIKG